jgi:hypothetical protein
VRIGSRALILLCCMIPDKFVTVDFFNLTNFFALHLVNGYDFFNKFDSGFCRFSHDTGN